MKRSPDLISCVLKVCVWAAAIFTLGTLAFMVVHLLINGIPGFKASLFAPTYTSENVSLLPAAINTFITVILTLIVTLPCGIGAAVYLVEYARRGNKLVHIVRVAAETLAGIPSIIYGLFGAIFFVRTFMLGKSVLAGSLTLAVMVLPIILRTTEEALKAVPDCYREGSFGLGAGKVRTLFSVIIPAAMPAIFAGTLLATGRIIGESAALIFTSGTIAAIATNVMNSGRTLAVHLYAISGEGLYVKETYATSVVLLVLVVTMNTAASWVAHKMENHQ